MDEMKRSGYEIDDRENDSADGPANIDIPADDDHTAAFGNDIRDALGAAYEGDGIRVTEDLISRTMARIREDAGKADDAGTKAAFEITGEVKEGVPAAEITTVTGIGRAVSRRRFFRLVAGIAAALFVGVLGLTAVRGSLFSKKAADSATANNSVPMATETFSESYDEAITGQSADIKAAKAYDAAGEVKIEMSEAVSGGSEADSQQDTEYVVSDDDCSTADPKAGTDVTLKMTASTATPVQSEMTDSANILMTAGDEETDQGEDDQDDVDRDDAETHISDESAPVDIPAFDSENSAAVYGRIEDNDVWEEALALLAENGSERIETDNDEDRKTDPEEDPCLIKIVHAGGGELQVIRVYAGYYTIEQEDQRTYDMAAGGEDIGAAANDAEVLEELGKLLLKQPANR